MNNTSANLQKSIGFLNSKIEKAANKTNRTYKDITLIAVTKSHPPPIWDFALKNNLSILAESTIQEAQNKLISCSKRKNLELHMIGHLQTNKVKKAIEMFDIIQSVDSFKLANRINTISKEKNKKTQIFLQVNTSNDPLKYGFSKENIIPSIHQISNLEHISVIGIMTIPKHNLPKQKLRRVYKQTYEIQKTIYDKHITSCKNLSMGMSNDFEIAIEEGATHIRIGTTLFGKRTVWS